MKLKKLLSSGLLLSAVVLGTVVSPLTVAAETTVVSTTEANTTQAFETPTTSLTPSTELPTTTVGPTTTEVASTTTSSTTSLPTTTAEDKETAEQRMKREALEREFGIEANVLEGIVGSDNQYRIKNTTVDPYRKIVRLYMQYPDGQYVGSGTMIAPNLILTAAHNVYDKDTGRWASSVLAVPAENGKSRPYGAYEASNYFILRNYKTVDRDEQFQQDVAVIKLKNNVSSRIGYLGVSTGGYVGQRVQMAGYPSYTATKRSYMYTMFGNISQREDNLFLYTIDTEGGQSGGPVLNNKNQIVAVHVLSRRYNYMGANQAIENGARRVDSDVVHLINQAKSNKVDIKVSTYKEGATTVYRLYHGGIKRHLYTKSLDEANILSKRGWNFEGAKFGTATKGTPVYRLYHSGTREHLYTTSTNERDVLSKRGWRYEGIAWYSTGKRPIYRLYHAGLKVHLYTADANEKNTLSKRGWKYEGVAFTVK